MVAVARIEYEYRLKEAEHWRLATEIERRKRQERGNRLFGRKARNAISIQE
jgi:hypothetical protein